MSDRPSLTNAQEQQLLLLRAASALDRQHAASNLPPLAPLLRPMVLGKLRDLRLVDSYVVRASWVASQHTAYWLTPAGVARARELVAG